MEKKSREIEKWKKNETIKGKLYNMRFASQVCAALLRRKGYWLALFTKKEVQFPQPKGMLQNLSCADRLPHALVFARTQNIYIRTRKHAESERILQTATYITGSHGGGAAIIKIKQIPIVF